MTAAPRPHSASVAALGALLAACFAEPPPARGPTADIVLQGVALDQYAADGRPSARARLAQASYLRATERLDGSGVRVGLLAADGSTDAVLVSGTGAADLRSGTLQLREGVNYEAREGDRLSTPSLLADLGSREASGSEGVRAQGPGYRIEARTFEARWGPGARLRFEGGARASFEHAPARRAVSDTGARR